MDSLERKARIRGRPPPRRLDQHPVAASPLLLRAAMDGQVRSSAPAQVRRSPAAYRQDRVPAKGRRLGELSRGSSSAAALSTVVSSVQEISLFTDVALDDSYTPSKISISAGTSLYDLQVVKTIDLEQPKGWQHFKLGTGADDDEAGADMPDDCSDDDDERSVSGRYSVGAAF